MGVEEPGHVWYCAVEVPGGAAGVLLELPALPGDGGGGAGEEVGMVGAGLGPPGPPQAGRLPRLLQTRDPSELAGLPVALILLAKDYEEATALLELQLAGEFLGEGGVEAN